MLTPLLTVFQLYCGCQFYSWRKTEYLKKTLDLPEVTDKLHHTSPKFVSSIHHNMLESMLYKCKSQTTIHSIKVTKAPHPPLTNSIGIYTTIIIVHNRLGLGFMLYNTTFNNISVIS